MVTDQETNKVYFSTWLTKLKCWQDIRMTLEQARVPYGLLEGTQDYWVRDFMPIQVTRNSYVQYVYNPDYLHTSPDYRTDGVACLERLCFPDSKVVKTDIVLDGGNVIKCDDSVIMTNKVFLENRQWSKAKVMDELERVFGAEVIIIPWDHHERYGHVDGMVRYLGDGRVLLTNYGDFAPEFAKELVKTLSHKYDVTELSYPLQKPSSYNWAYINYLQVGKVVLMPKLDDPENDMAYEQLHNLFPDASICRVGGIKPFLRRGGGLICVSWNVCN